jgi:hypothetical protein
MYLMSREDHSIPYSCGQNRRLLHNFLTFENHVPFPICLFRRAHCGLISPLPRRPRTAQPQGRAACSPRALSFSPHHPRRSGGQTSAQQSLIEPHATASPTPLPCLTVAQTAHRAASNASPPSINSSCAPSFYAPRPPFCSGFNFFLSTLPPNMERTRIAAMILAAAGALFCWCLHQKKPDQHPTANDRPYSDHSH